MKAIRESRIAVIVFSENYADSSWCLDELAYIMKCKDEIGQIVIPIFYHVDPSEVRSQKRKFGQAFEKHELKNSNKVESWKRALIDAGELSGWVPEAVANGHEAKFIKEIVNAISNRLLPLVSNFNENLVGLKTRLQELKSKLEIWSGGVRMVGIWGLGGGGKTTLASAIYDEIYSIYEGCCFVENIREESNKNGLKDLQVKILSSVLKQETVSIGSVYEGKQRIKSRLCHKKVLIVLDDVDHLDQLEVLAGSNDWFGEGSRIIITTRDVQLLEARKVNVIQNISLLNDKEAFELFRKHNAPPVNIPIEEYESLSKAVVSYAHGLPLALKVLGCFLCNKNIDEWRSALARLKEIPENDIVKKLKISYDGLKPQEQQLFLDIACFFRRSRKSESMEILEACGFHPVIGVKVLIEKALITVITVSNKDCFDMHDLVEEMGHNIVRGEHPHNLQKHSRVWAKEDIPKLCVVNNTMAVDIEAIRIHTYKYNTLPHLHHVVANMKRLRLLDWTGYSESSLPTNFPPVELRCLLLGNCLQRCLWEGSKNLPNLRMIKLAYMDNLIKTPNFGGLPNLERFELSWCPKLKEIHPSIGGLERLVHLKVECCGIRMLPSITRSDKLETFEIITQRNWNFHPHNIIFRSLHVFHRAVRKLTLVACYLKQGDIDSVVWDFPNLIELDLGCNDFSRLDFRVFRAPRLKWLDVSACFKLVELLGLPSSINGLMADVCDSLETVGDISHCKWLWKVSILIYDNRGVSHLVGDILQFMLQGTAVEYNFISFTTGVSINQLIPKGLVEKLALVKKGEIMRLQLPSNWFDDFAGFLICFAMNGIVASPIKITMNHEVAEREDSQNKVWLESNEPTPNSSDNFLRSYIGYVSFNSLIRDTTTSCTTWLEYSSYNTISFSSVESSCWFVADLVPKTSTGHHGIQKPTEFYEKEDEYGRKTFVIQHHSNSSINIYWLPSL